MRSLAALLLVLSGASWAQAPSDFARREDAYRTNNLGVALLEQFKHDEAAARFEQALALRPGFSLARLNLAIALFNAQKLPEARKAAIAALDEIPNSPQANYVLGLINRVENNQDESLDAFRRVLAIDPLDVGANINVGQIFSQQRKYDEAITHFRIAYDAESYNTTAVYNLATALQRTGQRERSAELLAKFQALRESSAGTSIGLNYLEQGRYAEAIASTGAESELVDPADPKVTFRESDVGLRLPRSRNFRAPAGAVLFDYDNDNDLDIALTNPARIFRNSDGMFADVTAGGGDYGRVRSAPGSRIIAGDFDRDSLADLFVVGSRGFSLYKNLGKGRFADATRSARIPAKADTVSPMTCAFLDVDHDGDLDIVIGGTGKARNRLFRNNGNSTFSDYSSEAKIDTDISAVSVVPTDFDNRRDIDLLFLSANARPVLFRNLRDTSFADVANDVGLDQTRAWTCAAAGDFNKDSYIDFFFGVAGSPGLFAVSDGRGKFKMLDAPAGTESAAAAQFLDYDSDGLLDLVVLTSKGFAVARNLGSRWTEADHGAFKTAGNMTASNQILSADIDADGDVDLFSFDDKGVLRFFRNEGGNRNNATLLRLQGRASNKTGVAAKIDMRSGSLAQKLEVYAASPAPAPSQAIFGLGKRKVPDAIRVIWASGTVQAEVDIPETATGKRGPFRIEELDRKPSSCPYLYTWNGERFEFVTDFLGGGEMGNWASTGVYHQPDSDEFIRITSDQLKPKGGRYEIRVTNELEEVLYLDHLKLLAVEHDADTEIYPNEGLGIPSAGRRLLHVARNRKPPSAATDSNGRDVLKKIEKLDRLFYDNFESMPIRGYAKTHEMIVDLGRDPNLTDGKTLLLLTGWTDYAFSSDNLSASQSGKSLQLPYLQVKNARGEWRKVIDSIGISVGRPQTVVVDLKDKFLSESREIRIVTNFKTYWDKIEIAAADSAAGLSVSEIAPERADLRERGFSHESVINGMITADYDTVVNDGRWKYFSGRFTRLGGVKPLLTEIDDSFVISKTGDELAISFKALDPAPAGRKYTFLLYADGYSKEMDINSGSPDSVFPLPFKGMINYPYQPLSSTQMSDERFKVFWEYTTRFARGGPPNLDLTYAR